MTQESQIIRDISVQQFAEIANNEPFLCVGFNGVDAKDQRSYKLHFITEHPQGPYLRIDTEPRRNFLLLGSEEQAQGALVSLGNEVRRKTGGFYQIHPFYGLVRGTCLTPVAPNFVCGHDDEDLSLLIYLTNQGKRFNRRLTQQSIAIGTTTTLPDPEVIVNLRHQYEVVDNPNQGDRDIAVTCGLGVEWNRQFNEAHRDRVPSAMQITVPNIVDLLYKLKGNGFDNPRVSQLALR